MQQRYWSRVKEFVGYICQSLMNILRCPATQPLTSTRAIMWFCVFFFEETGGKGLFQCFFITLPSYIVHSVCISFSDICPFVKTGESSSDLIRHFLIESSAKGVRIKGSSQEPYFGESSYQFHTHREFTRLFKKRVLLWLRDLSPPGMWVSMSAMDLTLEH